MLVMAAVFIYLAVTNPYSLVIGIIILSTVDPDEELFN